MRELRREIESDFGHWLAGFIDGEGCFYIERTKNGRPGASYGAGFHIGLRMDDKPILEEIRRSLGIGRFRVIANGGNRQPQFRWLVTKKDECVILMGILDRFPLRAKKARDYSIWSQAVRLWMKIHRGKAHPLQMEMARLAAELIAVRQYRCPDCVGA